MSARHATAADLMERDRMARFRRGPDEREHVHFEERDGPRGSQIILDERIAQPILIGRPDIVRRRAERQGNGCAQGQRARVSHEWKLSTELRLCKRALVPYSSMISNGA